jgi:5-methylthioadenosine/S-adenosylhomocysteine deaminase
LTVVAVELARAAAEYARRIDAFLIRREQSVLHKLVAIGGVDQQESFEVQVKAGLRDPATLRAALAGPEIQMVRHVHSHEFDTYFSFAPPEAARLRYREDEFLDEQGEVTNVRYRLTLIGPAKEAEYGESVLLSRSRFIAPANHSRRFYREYFQPAGEREIEKFRLRWLVRYKDTEFFVNLDRLVRPPRAGHYVEIKSRTWSKRDADEKAGLIVELLRLLGAEPGAEVKEEYVEWA